MKKILLTAFLFIYFFNIAKSDDSTHVLLLDTKIQFECSDAINDMYDFNFVKAEQKFTWMMQEYPKHPLPYFLMGLSNWWKIMPNDQSEEFDGEFEKYLDQSIDLAEKLKTNQPKNPEANFLLSAAYGLKARRASDKEQYITAALNTKRCLTYIDPNPNNELGAEFLLGSGLYNYFREWIPENKPILKPIVMMFAKGNKEVGIKQLEKVSKEAFYTRIEAMHFMIMIYEYENEERKAIPIARYLAKNYPNNPYFQRKLMKLNYMTGSNYLETIDLAKDIIGKFEQKQLGYEDVSARYANFYLASLQTNYTVENTLLNDKVKEYNKKSEKNNSKLHSSKVSNRRYNDSIHIVNSIITNKNKSLAAQNSGTGENTSSYTNRYNRKIESRNKKIQAYNKKVSQYNKKVKGNSAKKKGYLRLLHYDNDIAPSIKYNDKTIEHLKSTVELGKGLGYEKKNYNLKSLYLLGRIYWKEGKIEEAKKYYKELINVSKKKNKYRKQAELFLKKFD